MTIQLPGTVKVLSCQWTSSPAPAEWRGESCGAQARRWLGCRHVRSIMIMAFCVLSCSTAVTAPSSCHSQCNLSRGSHDQTTAARCLQSRAPPPQLSHQPPQYNDLDSLSKDAHRTGDGQILRAAWSHRQAAGRPHQPFAHSPRRRRTKGWRTASRHWTGP